MEGNRGSGSQRGHEGMAGRHYFAALRFLPDLEQSLMAFSERNRRPPRDPFNAALSFGYSLLYRDLTAAILPVGLGVLSHPTQRRLSPGPRPHRAVPHHPLGHAPDHLGQSQPMERSAFFDHPRTDLAVRRWPQAGKSASSMRNASRNAGGTWYSTTRSATLRPWSSRSVCWSKEWSGALSLFTRLRVR